MPISTTLRRRSLRWGVPAVLLASLATVAAVRLGEDPPAAHAVTSAEAQRFALARLSRFEASPTRVRVRVPQREATVTVDGVVDYRSHHGIGRFDQGSQGGLLAWDTSGLGVATDGPAGGAAGPAPAGGKQRALKLADAARMSTDQWSPRQYTSDPLDSMLKLTVLLGQDRPENAQLLAQSGARWTGTEEIDGRSYDIFAGPRPAPQGKKKQGAKPGGMRAEQQSGKQTGPVRAGGSPLRFYVAEDGALRRVTVRLPGQSRTGVVDFVADKVRQKVPGRPWQARQGH
ncbi:hypothetical protein [Streptomyces sp. NPDC051684]|uniref:hypothetical protein n=1 Tax=Streptomyces sp. NPDC051684 TaxID=3365670 RepID=UPI0037A0334D